MKAADQHIIIRGSGIISPLGHDIATVNQSYTEGKPAFKTILHNGELTPVAALPTSAEEALLQLIHTNSNYKHLDRSVQMAVYAARQASFEAGWLQESFINDDLAINIGSSRGATGLFEQHHDSFKKGTTGSVSPSASPTTTLGNLSSWVAHAVNAGGAQISHSITCSTALMAIANSVAWLKAGMAKRFLAGGTEAPLTPFTIAQMKAVGIYSKLTESPYPCQPYTSDKQNSFVLGEGAAVFAIEQVATDKLMKGDILVEAIGMGFEKINSKTGISAEGINFQKSMRHALEQLPESDQGIDLIITHTPGTRAGDKAELEAIDTVFGVGKAAITTNKWLIGHTLGASGALSLQFGMHILTSQHHINPPYLPTDFSTVKNPIKRIMINAAGFGGNAASLIIKIIL